MLFPANARIPSIDIVGGGTPETLQNGHGGGYRGSATDEAQWPIGPQTTGWGIAAPSPPIGRRWTIGRRCGRMGAQNGGQRPGLQRRGTPVKTQAWSATGGRDH